MLSYLAEFEISLVHFDFSVTGHYVPLLLVYSDEHRFYIRPDFCQTRQLRAKRFARTKSENSPYYSSKSQTPTMGGLYDMRGHL